MPAFNHHGENRKWWVVTRMGYNSCKLGFGERVKDVGVELTGVHVNALLYAFKHGLQK